MQRVRQQIVEAMAIIRRLYEANQVKAEQLEPTAGHLGTLSVVVVVNSAIHMAELALTATRFGTVPGLLCMAEGYLAIGPIQGREKAEKLEQIRKLRESVEQARNVEVTRFAAE